MGKYTVLIIANIQNKMHPFSTECLYITLSY